MSVKDYFNCCCCIASSCKCIFYQRQHLSLEATTAQDFTEGELQLQQGMVLKWSSCAQWWHRCGCAAEGPGVCQASCHCARSPTQSIKLVVYSFLQRVFG